MNDAFSRCHPAVNFLFFALVIVFSMCCMHPCLLIVSCISAALYLAVLKGKQGLRMQFRFLIPAALLAAILNPAFVHRGMTVIGHMPSGKPLTLESILYGLAAAGMMAAVFLWFACYTHVLTSDKFIYLFGRAIPSLSLVLSMTLRFVPRFRRQMRLAAQAQSNMGRSTEAKTRRQKAKNALKVFSVMVTWSLENAMETADSMKSRGYGEKGRTTFSLYRMDDRDRLLLLWFGFCAVYLTAGAIAGGLAFRYYPMIVGVKATPVTVSFFAVYALLCLTPVLLQLAAAQQWKRSGKEGHSHE